MTGRVERERKLVRKQRGDREVCYVPARDRAKMKGYRRDGMGEGCCDEYIVWRTMTGSSEWGREGG